MTYGLWSRGGGILVNAAGKPILCGECPTCEEPQCFPCETTFTISAASNTDPIVITTHHNSCPPLADGDEVVIAYIMGNIAANGTWTILVIDSTHFSLVGSDGTESEMYIGAGIVTHSTAQSVLFLSYEGFGEGVCSDVFPNDPDDYMDYCTSNCVDMTTNSGRHGVPWPLQYIDTNVIYGQPCSWGVTHNICLLGTGSEGDTPFEMPEYFWQRSVLFFKYDSSEGFWFLHLQLFFDGMFPFNIGSQGAHFEWAINVSEGCDDFDDHDCHELEGCVTFDSSNLISDGIPIGTELLNEWKAFPGFRGFNCPCGTGWDGEYTGDFDSGFQVKTTSWPGSGITATVTGW